jgi:hypothetical protein
MEHHLVLVFVALRTHFQQTLKQQAMDQFRGGSFVCLHGLTLNGFSPQKRGISSLTS